MKWVALASALFFALSCAAFAATTTATKDANLQNCLNVAQAKQERNDLNCEANDGFCNYLMLNRRVKVRTGKPSS